MWAINRVQFLESDTVQNLCKCYVTKPCKTYVNKSIIALTRSYVDSMPGPPPQADAWALAFFLPWMSNSQGWGLLSCQILRDKDGKKRQMPRPPSSLQHFSLIAQSNSAILSILMCDFLFQLMSSFEIALGF